MSATTIASRFIANTSITEAKLLLANNTTGDVTTSQHGFAPLPPNNADRFLDGTALYSLPRGNDIRGLQALGSPILTLPIGCTFWGNKVTVTPTTGVFHLTAHYLDKAATITGVGMSTTIAGVYTATGFNGVCVYSVSGGTLTRQAISAGSSTTLWKAVGNTQIPFTGTVNLAAGPYFIGILWNRSAVTTAPTWAAENPANTQSRAVLSNGLFLHMIVTGTTFTTPLSAGFNEQWNPVFSYLY